MPQVRWTIVVTRKSPLRRGRFPSVFQGPEPFDDLARRQPLRRDDGHLRLGGLDAHEIVVLPAQDDGVHIVQIGLLEGHGFESLILEFVPDRRQSIFYRHALLQRPSPRGECAHLRTAYAVTVVSWLLGVLHPGAASFERFRDGSHQHVQGERVQREVHRRLVAQFTVEV